MYKHIIIFLILGMSIASLLSWVSGHYAPVYPEVKQRMEQMMMKADSIETIAVGHSHNLAIDFRAMEHNGYHLWSAGLDMFETRYLLHYIVPLLPNLKTVIVSLSHYEFENESYSSKRWGFRNMGYYPKATSYTLRSIRLVSKNRIDKLIMKIHDLIRYDHWKGFVKFIIWRIWKAGDCVRYVDDYGLIKPSPDYYGFRSHEYLVKNSQEQIDHFSKKFKHSSIYKPGISEEIYGAISSMIAFLQKRDIRVVFYTQPYYYAYIDMMLRKNPDSITITRRYMRKLEESYGIEYYDFSGNSAFIHNCKYFANSSHMNAYGAQVFSGYFGDVMRMNNK
jgi:hypothetical protein